VFQDRKFIRRAVW